MSAIAYFIGSITLFIIGFFSEIAQGEQKGRVIGFNEGVKTTFQEVD